MRVRNRLRYIEIGVIAIILMILVTKLTGCAFLDSKLSDLKGTLVGNVFNISLFDNYGINFLTVSGKKVDVEGITVKVPSVNSDGTSSTQHELSSVLDITIDGSNMKPTGNTVIFAEEGLNRVDNFELPDTIQTYGGTLTSIDRNINKLENLMGTGKIIVIQSQLGVPIAVYGGESVYVEIPDDLPKMTKLNIDGKALYVHRANYVILDTDILD